MTPPKIDAPLKLGREFLGLWFIILLFSIWALYPFYVDQPNWVKVMWPVSISLFVSLIGYSIMLFLISLLWDFRGQRGALFVFCILVTSILMAFAIVNFRARPVPAYITGMASFFGFPIIRVLIRRLPNHSTDPSPAPGTSPAVQEPRHG